MRIEPASAARRGDAPARRILACAVTFEPNDESIRKLAALRRELPEFLIVDNSASAGRRDMLQRFAETAGVRLLQNPENVGQAAALNQGCRWAQDAGYESVLLFDQDTEVQPGFLKRFSSLLSGIPGDLANAVVGCEYTNIRRRARTRARGPADHSRQRVVITTGSLVPLSLWSRLGGFQSAYFIDLVDDEFCLRVRQAGGAVWRIDVPLIEHRIGNSIGQRWALNYSPLRWYHLVRNHVWTVRRFALFDPVWTLYTLALKGRLILGVLMHEPEKRQKVAAMARGAWHGIVRTPPELP